MTMFQKHKKMPKKGPTPQRGGPFADAIRSLIADGDVVSFAIDSKYNAPALRTRLGTAARALDVKITTRTAEGRVYAALRER